MVLVKMRSYVLLLALLHCLGCSGEWFSVLTASHVDAAAAADLLFVL